MVHGYVISGKMNTILNMMLMQVQPLQKQFQPLRTRLRLNPWDTTTDYYKEKCCKQLIWKGPKYTEHEYQINQDLYNQDLFITRSKLQVYQVFVIITNIFSK